jgi:Molybdopterin-binding domain of aldehyde dehydrogenase
MVELVNFTGADDFGRIINPLIVEGQVHGALVQGIGQALYENTVYDESGQLKTGSFMDYCMPRADNFLPFKLETNTTLCAHNPLGAKGCGEAGTIGAPPAGSRATLTRISGRLQRSRYGPLQPGHMANRLSAMKLAGDPNNPLRIREDASIEELRAEMMKHMGILIDGGVIDLEALLAEKRRTAN